MKEDTITTKDNNNNEKNLKIVTAIACAVALCSIAFGAWALLTKKSNSQEPGNTHYNQVSNIDVETINDLDTLTLVALGSNIDGGEYGHSVWVNAAGYPIAEELIEKGELSDKSKVTTIVEKLWNNQTGVRPVTEEEAAQIANKTNQSIDKVSRIKVLDASAVEKEYQKVYGEEEIQHQGSLICGSPIYDSEINLYYIPLELGGCGGSPYYTKAHFYKYDYKIDGDKAYVYVASAAENRDNQICKLTKNGAKDCQTMPELYSFTLGETNYEQFPKHRLIFVKATDGEYYFEKVESL